jgi:hypothetical protein
VDLGRERRIPAAVRVIAREGEELSGGGEAHAREGHGEGLRRSRGEAAGAEPGSSSIERTTVNTGTVRWQFPTAGRPGRR